MGATVIACGYSPPILEASKHALYLMPLFVKLLIVEHRLLPTAPAWNAWRDPLVTQSTTKPVSVIPPIRQKFFGLGQRIEQDGSAFIIAHLTIGQVKGYRLAGSITNSMKF